MRNKGYYWIKINQTTDWQFGYWNGSYWTICGTDRQYNVVMLVERIQIQNFEAPAGKKSHEIYLKIDEMEVDEVLPIQQFVQSIWGEYDSYIRRSFNVIFGAAKKKIPEKKFQVIRGEIKRIT